MPKMINLRRETTDDDIHKMTAYPGGTCLYLGQEQCEQIGVDKALKVGTEVTIYAKAIVVSTTSNLNRELDEKGEEVSLSLQITDLGIDIGAVRKDAARMLYGTD